MFLCFYVFMFFLSVKKDSNLHINLHIYTSTEQVSTEQVSTKLSIYQVSQL
jgi:hypothetical protein